jgi:uncharacterized membrane protein YdbT with pleckstrin-like domain
MTTSARSILETGIIVLGIASFWPYTAGYRAVWYEIGLVVVLVALAVLAVVRWRRFQRVLEELKTHRREP